MSEAWRAIPGFEGLYEVSSAGRVRSLDRPVRCGKGRGMLRGRILSPTCGNRGYPVVSLCVDGAKFTRHVHRLVLLAFVGECPPGNECRHINGDCGDARLSNLAWGTSKENAQDRIRHGTQTTNVKLGASNGMAKLTARQAREIRRRRLAGEKIRDLAEEFGVHHTQISSIALGKTWAHV